MSHRSRAACPRRGVAAVVAAVVSLVLASCGVTVGRGAAPATSPGSTPSTGIVGTKVQPPSSTTAPTTTTTPPPTNVVVHGDNGSATNKIVENAIADLTAWWTTEFPALFHRAYRPISGGFYAIDSTTSPVGIPCAPNDINQVLDNAYYCPDDDAIVWDQEKLVPNLANKFGAFTVAVVLAHEWGHSIQRRVGFTAATVILEQQADCYAGAWSAHVKTDANSRFRITTDDLDHALAGFLSLRDAPGSSATDPNAHGSGFDRVRAFQDGFEKGAVRCSQYRDGDPQPFQFQFSDQNDLNNNGNLPLERTGPCTATDESGCTIIDLLFPSLDTYWTGEYPKLSGGKKWNPLGPPKQFAGDNAPDCNGQSGKGYRLFVCIPGRFVAFDATETIPAIYQSGGDFAVATLIATQYGLDIESQLGTTPTNQVTATLRGDCYAGSYAGSILPTSTPTTTTGITLSPGDLDEAVAVLLSSRSAADRARQGPGFDRVRAFGTGVTQGARACATVEPS